jgi:hypothetical protein
MDENVLRSEAFRAVHEHSTDFSCPLDELPWIQCEGDMRSIRSSLRQSEDALSNDIVLNLIGARRDCAAAS